MYKDILDDKSLTMIHERLNEIDWQIISALKQHGVMNKKEIMATTHLSISDVRDSVWRLYGGCIIYMRRLGNYTELKLTLSGNRLIELAYQDYKRRDLR